MAVSGSSFAASMACKDKSAAASARAAARVAWERFTFEVLSYLLSRSSLADMALV
jgi:hypothetical protein